MNAEGVTGSNAKRTSYTIRTPVIFFYRGKVCNYSKRGLYFESNVDLLPEDEISILVKKDTNDVTYMLNVKIIWSKELQGVSFDVGYGAFLKERRTIGVR